MYKHILIPTDGSPTADKAVEQGIEFARQANAKVTFFTAMPEYQQPGEGELMSRRKVVSVAEHDLDSYDKAERILSPAANRARAAGLKVGTDYKQSNRPYEAIIDAAERHGCDLILMCSHGRKGVPQLLYGSETRDVLTHSSIPTLVLR